MVGPILPLEKRPIPEGLLEWMNNQRGPIVYMAMGTMATWSSDLAHTFMEAFEGEEYGVVWSLPGDQRDVLNSVRVPDNVRLESFVPQRELLEKEEVKVFVSHAGASSSHEALLSGTPVVCMPFFSDQFEFCSRITASGAGQYLDKRHLSSEEIRTKVRRALSDEGIQASAEQMKSLMNCGGTKRAAHLILSTYSLGSDHLIPYVAHLPWWQRQAYDLKCVKILVQFVAGSFVWWLVFTCCLRRR